MIDGVVGKVLVSPRSVVRRGEPMIEIAGASLPGKIAKVSVIADALPKEFQKAFAPAERQQLMWIEFDPGVTPPPYFTKVTIS